MPPDSFNPVVVAPTYDNARTLDALITGVAALGLPLIVVNDGSTDATADILDAAQQRHAGLTVLTHPRNRGKAAALRTGFAHAREMGHTHAITIDTDGQHDPAEIPKLIERATQSPTALILGLRDERAHGYPARSRLGRRLSNFFIRLESGLRVEDSQCGLRVYPLGLIAAVRCGAGRFGFETEIVTRAAWAGCPVIEVPVACRYLPPGERVSHLNPLLDTLRAVAMHARLLGRALLPWSRHPQWPARDHEVATRADTCADAETVRGAAIPRRSWGRRFLRWIDPRDAWRQARRDRVSRETFAAGLAVGAFIGNLPAYGFHAPLGLYVAQRLHLHPVAVFVGTNVSIPPIGPLLNAAAIALGHVLLRGSLPTPDAFDFSKHSAWSILGNLLLEWSLGSVLVGLLCAAIVFLVSNRLLRRAPIEGERPSDPAASDAPTAPAAPALPEHIPPLSPPRASPPSPSH